MKLKFILMGNFIKINMNVETAFWIATVKVIHGENARYMEVTYLHGSLRLHGASVERA